MNVSLTPELSKLVHAKVKSGLYLSASEVVRDALRLLDERDRLKRMQLQDLRKKIAVGIEQADRGQLTALDLDQALLQSRKRLSRKKRA